MMITSKPNNLPKAMVLTDPVFKKKAEQPSMNETGWSPWRMDTIVDPETLRKQQEQQQAEPDPELVRQQQLEQERKNTLQKAQEQGYATGHAEGLAAGNKEGYDAGYERGYNEGLAAAAELTASHQARLLALAEQAQQQYANLDASMGQALIELATTIARHVIGQELKQHPEHLIPLVRQAITQPPGINQAMAVQLNPEDYALIEKSGQLPLPEHIRLKADPNIEPGGWYVQTAYGEIDATLQTRWAQVLASLGLPAPQTQQE
ncbi:MAG: flagellar assembly protein FliH [Advenella sp.]